MSKKLKANAIVKKIFDANFSKQKLFFNNSIILKYFLKELTWERFQFVMTKIEKRLDAATDVMRSLETFGRRAMEELSWLHEDAEQNRDDPIEENERSFDVESLMYKGVNLLGLGGDTPRENNF